MASNTVQTDARLGARARTSAEMAAWIPTGARNATSPRRMALNWTAAVSLRPMSPPRSTAPQRASSHPASCSKVLHFVHALSRRSSTALIDALAWALPLRLG
jgi:hypothetical protein